MSKYKPQTLAAKLGHLVEECGELQSAVGKTIRHGLLSVNPELGPEDQETNAGWILREMKDVVKAIQAVRDEIESLGIE